MMDPVVKDRLRKTYLECESEGEMLPDSQLAEYYRTFRQRFGPEVLSQLDGEALLNTMHLHQNKDSLVYWLEFKNDREFPARFGGIGGGSALKYGIYRKKGTEQWMTGSPRELKEITTREAEAIARRNRDQLLLGHEILERFTPHGLDADYRKLQEDLHHYCPDVADTSWGHKYFCLLHPDKLDDFHAEEWQRYHLIKCLQMPPEGHGRYVCAGQFVSMARELGTHMNNLTRLLVRLNSAPHYYYLLNARDASGADHWEERRIGSFIGLGWPELGDLSGIPMNLSRARQIVDEKCLSRTGTQAIAYAIDCFLVWMSRAIVVVHNETAVLAIGRVTGEYSFEPASPLAHRLPVEWLSFEPWTDPSMDLPQKPVSLINKAGLKISIERRLLSPTTQRISAERTSAAPLTGIPGRAQGILERKGQVILYGPPGTGKTFWAELTAREVVARSVFRKAFDDLDSEEKAAIVGDNDKPGLVRMCCFHPAYGYEDFIEGYRPYESAGQVSFRLRDGVFKRLCRDAESDPRRIYCLVIDEINRGDIPRIFGELLTIIEKDKRGKAVLLPLSGEPFQVPRNVFIIGTMNTADRSIALLDTALRRRFGFIELMPDPSVLAGATIDGFPLGPWLDSLNSRIMDHAGRDSRNLQVGHSYLLEGGKPISDFGKFARILQEDIIPLVQEYCYEDYNALEAILGEAIVDAEAKRIRMDLFDAGSRDKLISALLAFDPEITSLPESVAVDQDTEDPERSSEEEQGGSD